MTEIVLHHFDASPFSEKVRLLLGYKNAPWHSVQIPRILPKPDLMPLTGGYRKTPVLQLGRDVYCDTRLIARTIERLYPTPEVVPPALAASVNALEQLADRQMFLAAIPVLFRPEGRAALRERLGDDYLARFQADRAALFSGGTVSRPDADFSAANWEPTLALLDAQLGASDYLLGSAPTLADFAVYHPVWYVRGNAGVGHTLEAFPSLMQWFERMRAIGHGQPSALDSTQALAMARETTTWQPLAGTFDTSLGHELGQSITVGAGDYGVDRISGRLVHLSGDVIVVERDDDTIGPVRVHCPRAGFVMASAG